MIAYRAMLDVPRELAREVAKLLRAERRTRGTRSGSRALTCWNEALLVLAWFRNQGDIGLYAAERGSRPLIGVARIVFQSTPQCSRRRSR